jgi:hypothetical protein
MRDQPKLLKSKNQQQCGGDLLRFVDFEPRLADAHSNSMNLSRTCSSLFCWLKQNMRLRTYEFDMGIAPTILCWTSPLQSI